MTGEEYTPVASGGNILEEGGIRIGPRSQPNHRHSSTIGGDLFEKLLVVSGLFRVRCIREQNDMAGAKFCLLQFIPSCLEALIDINSSSPGFYPACRIHPLVLLIANLGQLDDAVWLTVNRMNGNLVL